MMFVPAETKAAKKEAQIFPRLDKFWAWARDFSFHIYLLECKRLHGDVFKDVIFETASESCSLNILIILLKQATIFNFARQPKLLSFCSLDVHQNAI